MIVYTDGRQTGRTRTLAVWLIGGESVPGWPGWSRILVVHTEAEAQRILTDYPDVQAALRRVFRPALGKLVITRGELAHVRRVMDPTVELAVDNADWIIRDALLGVHPAAITLQGIPASVLAPGALPS